MPVPSSMQDLAKIASDNSPAGSEAIGTNLDNYLRAVMAIVRQTYSLASLPIAAGSTVDVAAADGESVEITGSATISSLGAGFVGCVRELRFAGICAVVHSNNLVLQRGISITTGAGDALIFRCLAPGQWKQITNSDAVNTAQLNEAIEKALGSNGNYQVTPRRWDFTGDGSVVDIPIPGADVPDPAYYYVAMEETAGSGLFGVQRPFADYTVVIDPADTANSVMRFVAPPPNTAQGDIRLLGYARPFLGPAPTVAAPWTLYTLAGDSLTVDHTFRNTLILTTANVPVTITIAKNTGAAATDWTDGEFFAVCQLGTGQVTVAIESGGDLVPPVDFELKSRARHGTIAFTCVEADADRWRASGDLLRTAVTPLKQLVRLADRSVLSGTNITTGERKDSFIAPYDMQLDAIADNGVVGNLGVAQAAGSTFTFDISAGTPGGTLTSIFATKPTIGNGQFSTIGAAVPAVYSSAFLAANRIIPAGSEVSLDVTQLGTALAKMLSATLRFQRAN